MFKQWKRFTDYLGWLTGSAPRRHPYRASPRVEALEERWCPAGIWYWTGPIGGGGLWSNANGGMWATNGAAAPANTYPGMPGSNGDIVRFGFFPFTGVIVGDAEMDVPSLAPLQSLEIQGWNHTLTLDDDVTVTGAQGDFQLTDGSMIRMVNDAHLVLQDLNLPQNTTANLWSGGTISSLFATSALEVKGSTLALRQSPISLSTTLEIGKSNAGAAGDVILSNMTGNLNTLGLPDQIFVQDGGSLEFNQQVAAGRQNLDGGIDNAGNTVFVVVEQGGLLSRNSIPIPGVPDQVSIAGVVNSTDGKVSIAAGNMLTLTGLNQDGTSSYSQSGLGNSELDVGSNANFKATGTFQIEGGTVNLSTGTGAVNALTSSGVIFSRNNTFLNIKDSSIGVPGLVAVSGPVTLATNTTLMENFSGANNTADMLYITNGALQLGGTLALNSVDQPAQKPAGALDFIADGSIPPATPSILGVFASITDNVQGTDNFAVVTNNPAVFYYQVTIT